MARAHNSAINTLVTGFGDSSTSSDLDTIYNNFSHHFGSVVGLEIVDSAIIFFIKRGCNKKISDTEVIKFRFLLSHAHAVDNCYGNFVAAADRDADIASLKLVNLGGITHEFLPDAHPTDIICNMSISIGVFKQRLTTIFPNLGSDRNIYKLFMNTMKERVSHIITTYANADDVKPTLASSCNAVRANWLYYCDFLDEDYCLSHINDNAEKIIFKKQRTLALYKSNKNQVTNDSMKDILKKIVEKELNETFL